jgi:hypothetical protein
MDACMSDVRGRSNTGDVGEMDCGGAGSAGNLGTAEIGGTTGTGGASTGATGAGASIRFGLDELSKEAESIGGGTMEEPAEERGATGTAAFGGKTLGTPLVAGASIFGATGRGGTGVLLRAAGGIATGAA